MKYKELLYTAKRLDLNITKLFIANEVEKLLNAYNNELNSNVYEEICSVVYEYYLKIDYSSINDVAKIVCDMFINSKKVDERLVRKELENMYL